MKISRQIDIEDEIRKAISDYVTIYCRPLPADFALPCILVTQVGGTDESGKIDTFEVTFDARAKTDAEANEYLRTAVGILRKVASEQQTPISHISVNTSGGWGADPARPDIKMFSARLRVVAHSETIEIGG